MAAPFGRWILIQPEVKSALGHELWSEQWKSRDQDNSHYRNPGGNVSKIRRAHELSCRYRIRASRGVRCLDLPLAHDNCAIIAAPVVTSILVLNPMGLVPTFRVVHKEKHFGGDFGHLDETHKQLRQWRVHSIRKDVFQLFCKIRSSFEAAVGQRNWDRHSILVNLRDSV